MALEKITKQLEAHHHNLPPVESWNPPYCGEIDMQIKANGDWFYSGTIIKRIALIKLFASVLIMEEGDLGTEYFLVTPVEKVKITVDDAPFMLTQWRWLDNNESVMKVSTNLDDEFTLNKQQPLTIADNGELYVTVRRNLLAKVHRNVYYQWVDIATEHVTDKGTELILSSDNYQFSLGSF